MGKWANSVVFALHNLADPVISYVSKNRYSRLCFCIFAYLVVPVPIYLRDTIGYFEVKLKKQKNHDEN